ncbi:MAG: Ku protein [Lachnospiraceae bacterium]|nr:Ku protein [Lachnospiraceae bacterium]
MAVAHKGSISMSLVLIPVGLYKTTVDNDIHFNQLDKESGARIKYKKYCSHCGKEVTPQDIVKGYEYEKGKYVTMTEEELDRLKTNKDRTIHIVQCSKMSEIDMIYYEKDYYAVPDKGAEKAFELLRQTLLSLKMVGIAKTVIGQTEKTIVLYPLKDGLIAKTLYYYDEIAEIPRKVPKMQLDKKELDMAKLLVQSMAKPFVAADFHDEYQERLREAIMQKIKGKDVLQVDQGAGNNVIDLMEALQGSLELINQPASRKQTGHVS